MFFTFAAHVEATSVAGIERGQDLTFYRAHLQKASGLDAAEYARVLDAAQRFAAVDEDVRKQISELVKEATSSQSGTTSPPISLPAGYRDQINSLLAQKTGSLKDEIANVRQALGNERTSIFETYLQTKYVMGHLGPALPAKSSPLPTQGQSNVMPNVLDPGKACQDFPTDDEAGYMEICADAQISYLGSPDSDVAEFYASMSASGEDSNGILLTGYSVEGDFYINGDEDQDLDCEHSDPDTACWTDVQLTSGNGVTYGWISTGYADYEYDYNCVNDNGDPIYCYTDSNQEDSNLASVTINYPDINTLSTDEFTQGKSGSFTIDGEYLMSVFENTPTVTVTDQSAIFSTFEITNPGSYPDGDITISYVVKDAAPVGTYALTVNNGFGADSYDIKISEAAPPVVVNPISGDWYAGQTMSVTITGSGFGTAPTVTLDPSIATFDITGTPTNTKITGTVTVPTLVPSETVTVSVTDTTAGVTVPPGTAQATVVGATFAMSVTPTGVKLDESQTKQFTATLTCITGQGQPCSAGLPLITWSRGPALGSIDSSGLYTAPSTGITKNTLVMVTACAAPVNAAICGSVDLTLEVPVSISSPVQGDIYPLGGTDYDAAVTFNATTSSGSDVSWTLNLAYTTSGGQCANCTNEKDFTTDSGENKTETYTSMGGKLVATAADDTDDTANVTAYVVGTAIPNSLITTQLTSLYAPSFQGYTPQLLCQIAMQETGGLYAQFYTRTLYGVSALWPLENGATSEVPAGSYIGLMQVPTTMATAFDWYKNTEAGNSVFEQKIAAVLRYQTKELAAVPGLTGMSGQQIEDSALSFYGGFLDQSSTAKKKPALHYYIPGIVSGQHAWVLNPADSLVSSEGISATQYVNGVRNWQIPN